MDFQRNTYKSQNMAAASLILGVVTLMTSGCIYLATICGALGIILALLSKGGSLRMNSQAKIGLALSSAGLTLTLMVYLGAFLFLIYHYGSFDAFWEEYLRLYNASSLEELYKNMGLL